MWKMSIWLAKVIASVLIASFLSIWTTGYIVNSYAESLLKQFNVPLKTQPVALSGVWGKLWGASSVNNGQTADTEEAEPDSSSLSAAGIEDTTPTPDPETDLGALGRTDSMDDPIATETFGEASDVSPVTGTGTGSKLDSPLADNDTSDESDPTADSNSVVTEDNSNPADSSTDKNALNGANSSGVDKRILSDEDNNGGDNNSTGTSPADGAKMAMTDLDRTALSALLRTKLPQQSWQTISTYIEGGLTEDELSKTEQIMAQYLSRDEYEKMEAILKKY